MSRRRFVYTQGGAPLPAPVEVQQDWRQPDSGPSHKSEEEVYGRLGASTDGVDISTRRRHAQHMKQNGLTIAEDFKGTWEKAAKEREAFRQGESQAHAREVREEVGRAFYQQQRGRK